MIETLSAAYRAAAAWRREWYARDPSRRRRLSRPVVSVGNLRVGGSGKTPTVEYIARLLVEHGERPAILTRGYARRRPLDGVTIPHESFGHVGAGKVLLKPASPGTGVIAGGAVRAVVESAGIHDVLSKSLGTSNKHNVVHATVAALKALTAPEKIAAKRSMSIDELGYQRRGGGAISAKRRASIAPPPAGAAPVVAKPEGGAA